MFLHSKLRSWLTILGIFIGVTSVIAIISLGQGLQASVDSELGGLGQDIITITSGGGQALQGPPGTETDQCVATALPAGKYRPA